MGLLAAWLLLLFSVVVFRFVRQIIAMSFLLSFQAAFADPQLTDCSQLDRYNGTDTVEIDAYRIDQIPFSFQFSDEFQVPQYHVGFFKYLFEPWGEWNSVPYELSETSEGHSITFIDQLIDSWGNDPMDHSFVGVVGLIGSDSSGFEVHCAVIFHQGEEEIPELGTVIFEREPGSGEFVFRGDLGSLNDGTWVGNGIGGSAGASSPNPTMGRGEFQSPLAGDLVYIQAKSKSSAKAPSSRSSGLQMGAAPSGCGSIHGFSMSSSVSVVFGILLFWILYRRRTIRSEKTLV